MAPPSLALHCNSCCLLATHPPQGVSGFLPKKEAAAAGRPLTPGALLEVVVAPGGVKPAGSGATSVTVQCSHEAVSGAVAREWEGLNIGEGAGQAGSKVGAEWQHDTSSMTAAARHGSVVAHRALEDVQESQPQETTLLPPCPAPSTDASALCHHHHHLSTPPPHPHLTPRPGSLLPGQLVTARVRNVLSDGLLCSFLTYFRQAAAAGRAVLGPCGT